MTLETRPATTSFLGLPLRVGPGDTIIVTDNRGQTVRGPITKITSTTLGVGPANRFDAASIQQIKSRPGLEWGRLGGVLGAALTPATLGLACVNSSNNCFTLLALVGAAGGALIGVGLDAAVMRQAYRRTAPSGSPAIAWRPYASGKRLGIHVSMQF